MANLTSQLYGNFQLADCLSATLEPSNEHPSTHGYLRNKPQKKQTGQMDPLAVGYTLLA